MRTAMKVLAWLGTVLAAAGMVGGAYLYGVNAGLLPPDAPTTWGHRLLADQVFQRVVAERTADAIVEQAPALEPRREAIVEAAVALTETVRYRDCSKAWSTSPTNGRSTTTSTNPWSSRPTTSLGFSPVRSRSVGALPLGSPAPKGSSS